MVEVSMEAAIVVVVVAVNLLVRDAATINMVEVVEVMVSDVLDDTEIIVVGVIENVLKFALTVSYSVDVSSDVAVGLSMDALAGVMFEVLSALGIIVTCADSTSEFCFRRERSRSGRARCLRYRPG